MHLDKVIDSNKLNNNLTNIANKIRIKSDDNAVLSFPNGFIESIDEIGISYRDAISYLDKFIKRDITTFNGYDINKIGSYAFYNCRSLTEADFPECISIDSYAFCNCRNLSKLILRNSTVCILVDTTAFLNAFATSGYIYVPASLVNAYKSATNWAYYSRRIRAIEDMV